jgi:hypothetical protein
MFSQRVTIHPSPDKIAAARTLLQARVTAGQAAGQQIALSELIAGKQAPEFQVIVLYPDLAAFEAQRKRNAADKSFVAFATKLAATLRAPVITELFEVLVAMPGTGPAATKGGRGKK